MKVLAITLAALSLAAGTPTHWQTFRSNAINVRYPARWFATAHLITAVTWPKQFIALASYPLPTSNAGSDGCEPNGALERIPPTGAFIFGWEYGHVSSRTGIRPSDFPPRPTHFRLTNFARYECFGPSYLLRFSDAGLAFQIQIAFGKHATATTRATVLRILDGISTS